MRLAMQDATTNRETGKGETMRTRGMGRGETGADHSVQSTMAKILSFRLGREDSVVYPFKARHRELSQRVPGTPQGVRQHP